MKITDHEREVISCMYFRADMPMRAVAEETGLREHVVRRCLDNLLSRKVLSLSPLVNPFAIGLFEYMSLLNVRVAEPAVRQKLLATLIQSPYTTFVGTVGGDYHICVMFATRGPHAVPDFFYSINQHVPAGCYEALTSACISVSLFAPKYLGAKNYAPLHQTYGVSDVVHEIDNLDVKILTTMVTASTISPTHISRVVGVPASTVTYRLSSLKERGILCGVNYALPPFSDGAFPFALQIRGSTMSREVRARFFDYCVKHPALKYCIETVGEWNFDVGVRLPDPRLASTLIDELQQAFSPYLSKVLLLPVHEHKKLSPGPLGMMVPAITDLQLAWKQAAKT